MWLALVGTPCGGTNYVRDCLRHVGVYVGHEGIERHGISCGFFLFGMRFIRIENFAVEHVVRLARHPLRVAETLPQYVRPPRKLPVVAPWRHDDPVVSALRWWVMTHEKLPLGTPMVRVGTRHLHGDWARLLRLLGLEHVPLSGIPVTPRTKGLRWDPLTWDEWRRRDPDFAERGWRLTGELDLWRVPYPRSGW
jgi:hypothetical protein